MKKYNDMFEENEKSKMKITQRKVEYNNSEIEVSSIDFSDKELFDATFKEFKDLGLFDV